MTYQESTQCLQRLAKDVGSADVPVFFSDRAFRQPLCKAVGTVADYLEQLSKNPPNEPATSLSANGVECPVLDVVAGKTDDGRTCVIFEYDSVAHSERWLSLQGNDNDAMLITRAGADAADWPVGGSVGFLSCRNEPVPGQDCLGWRFPAVPPVREQPPCRSKSQRTWLSRPFSRATRPRWLSFSPIGKSIGRLYGFRTPTHPRTPKNGWRWSPSQRTQALCRRAVRSATDLARSSAASDCTAASSGLRTGPRSATGWVGRTGDRES